MSIEDDIAGTKATNKSPKHANGVHVQEVIGACSFTSDQTDLTTYVVETVVLEHTPRGGALKQEAGTVLGWAQPADKNHKPAIKSFCITGAKALAAALGKNPDDVKENDITGAVIKAMFPKGNENKNKSCLVGLRFVTDSTPKRSEKGDWTLVIWQHAKEQPAYKAAQAKIAGE